MMLLRTLGGLQLEPSPFTQPKPLLLLTYLALEGPQQRRHLAELFWQEGNRMKSLSMTLTRLQQGAGAVAQADDKRVWATLESDAKAVLESLDKRDWQKASDLYSGAFLEGVVLETWGSELEEWVYTTREYLAERVQHALLNLAEAAAKKQDFGVAVGFAERAYKLPGLGGSEGVTLRRLYALLCAGDSLLAPEVRKEAEGYGVTLKLTSEKARAKFKQPATKTVTTTTTLPMRGTSFVGRDVELTELATLLSQAKVSLLTLLGPAGVGKTRLALQLTHEQLTLGAFKDGVYFIPLDALSDARLIPSSLLGHLGLGQHAKREPLEQLTDFIGERTMLLVLDNFEHVSGGAGFLPQLLSKCPNLKLLVTSRERVRLEEEYSFPVEGLPYPKTLSDTDDAELSDDAKLSDAIQLFKERAQQAQPHFDLERELHDVIGICGLVEGLPLGIELAAGWVRLMSCADIAGEIQKNLEFLSSSTTNIPERQRSLKATFESSWKLLNQKEQDVLKRLSVFRGGFRRDAASVVADATIPVLASLVDKSLLRVLPNGRYDRHPLLYQFTQEKLAERPYEQRRAQAKHAAYYLRLARVQEEAVQQGRQKEALDVLQAEWENIRTLFEHSLEQRDWETLQSGLELLEMLHDTRGSYAAALEFLGRAESVLTAHGPEAREVLGSVRALRAWFELRRGHYDTARASIQEALPYLGAASRWRVSALNILGILERRTGAYNRAQETCEEGLALARAQQDELHTAKMLASLADTEEALGDYAASERHFLEAIALYKKHGRTLGTVRNLNNLGWLYYVAGRSIEAEAAFSEGLRHAREIDFRQTIPYLLNNLGYIALEAGRLEEAQELNEEALALARESGEQAVQAEILISLARVAAAVGALELARNRCREALRLAWSVPYITLVLQALLVQGELFCKAGEVEEAAKLFFLVKQHPAATGVEKTAAQGFLKGLERDLSAEAFDEGERFGQMAPLSHIVEILLAGNTKRLTAA